MRSLTHTALLVLIGLVGACADDGQELSDPATPQTQQDALDQRRPAPTSQAGGDGVACPAIALAPDGKCEPRDLNVPCPLPDPDCPVSAPVACTKIWKLPDGVCDLTDPCAKLQDADCQGGARPGCDPGGPVCPAVIYETNGKCEAPPECAKNDPVDCAVACIAIRYADNGKCEAAKGCEANDPIDCAAVACDLIRYADNGKCEAPRGCEASDPVDCAGVICTAIRYADNGKCEAPRGCEASDPVDCASQTHPACIEIAFATNGKCEAAKGCEYTDPVDCAPVACTAIYRPRDGVCVRDDRCDPDCR